MLQCNSCGSLKLRRNGAAYTKKDGSTRKPYKCKICGLSQSLLISSSVLVKDNQIIVNDEKTLKSIVITSAKNNTDTHRGFYETLLTYVKHNDCDFYILPTRHKNMGEEYIPDFDNLIQDHLLQTSLEFPSYNLKIFGNLKLSASLENPL